MQHKGSWSKLQLGNIIALVLVLHEADAKRGLKVQGFFLLGEMSMIKKWERYGEDWENHQTTIQA